MNYQAISDAVRGWAKAALSYDDAHVILFDQTGGRPTPPYVTVSVLGAMPMGPFDPTKQSDTPGTPALGHEVTLTVTGQRELSVSIQVVTDETVGNSQARALAARIQTCGWLPSVKRLFTAAGLYLFEVGKVGGGYEQHGAGMIGRAVIDAKFYTSDTASETDGYVTAVSGTGPAGDFQIGTPRS